MHIWGGSAIFRVFKNPLVFKPNPHNSTKFCAEPLHMIGNWHTPQSRGMPVSRHLSLHGGLCLLYSVSSMMTTADKREYREERKSTGLIRESGEERKAATSSFDNLGMTDGTRRGRRQRRDPALVCYTNVDPTDPPHAHRFKSHQQCIHHRHLVSLSH
jgi:hypothetical protein